MTREKKRCRLNSAGGLEWTGKTCFQYGRVACIVRLGDKLPRGVLVTDTVTCPVQLVAAALASEDTSQATGCRERQRQK